MKITEGKMRLLERLNDQFDDHMYEIYRDYSSVFTTWKGWSIEKWKIYGDELYLSLSYSARGCTDYESLSLSAAWIYLSTEERQATIAALKAEEDAKEEAKKAASERARIEKELAEYQRLKEMFGK